MKVILKIKLLDAIERNLIQIICEPIYFWFYGTVLRIKATVQILKNIILVFEKSQNN